MEDEAKIGCLFVVIMCILSLVISELATKPYRHYKRSLYIVYQSDDVCLDVSDDEYHHYTINFYNGEEFLGLCSPSYFLGTDKEQAYIELKSIIGRIGNSNSGIYADDYGDTITWNNTIVFFKDKYEEQGWMHRDELDDMCDALACYDFEKTKQPIIIWLSVGCGVLVLIIVLIIASKLGLFRWLRERNRHHY